MTPFESGIERFHSRAQTIEKPLTLPPKELLTLHRSLQEQLNDDYLNEAEAAVNGRANLMPSIKEMLRTRRPDMVNQAEGVYLDLKSVARQVDIKKKWNTWEYVKSVPGRIWKTIKKHPWATAAVVVGVGGLALYASGYGAPLFSQFKNAVIQWFMGDKVAAAAETAREAAGAIGEKAGELGDKAAEGVKALKDAFPGGAGGSPVPAVPEMAPVTDYSGVLDEVNNAANSAMKPMPDALPDMP